MRLATPVAAALVAVCAAASAQDVVLTGHVQRVMLQPPGTGDCPPPPGCPAPGAQPGHVCISNDAGCQTMEIAVDHVYRGDDVGPIRQFRTRIGEFGPTFGAPKERIVVIADKSSVAWSYVTARDGKLYFDPTRIPKIGDVRTAPADGTDLVALEDVLARAGARQ